MKVSRNVRLLIHILESFLTTWALMKAARLEPGNILTGVFFLLSFFSFDNMYNHCFQDILLVYQQIDHVTVFLILKQSLKSLK